MITVSPDFTIFERCDHMTADIERVLYRLELRRVRGVTAFVGMELQIKAISCVLDVDEA